MNIEPSRNGNITLLFTDTRISCPSREFLTLQICLSLLVRVLCLSLFCYALLCVHSSFAIILKKKRKLVALLLLSYKCIVTINVLWVFYTVSYIIQAMKSTLNNSSTTKEPTSQNDTLWDTIILSFGSKDCTKELKPECAYFLGQTS